MMLLAVDVAVATEPSGVIVAVEGKNYYLHTVERGDTLYSLSKAYNVTTQDIMACNEGLTASTLKAGNKLLIPYSDLSAAESEKASEQEDDKRFRLHTIERGETLYSIARTYKISVSVIEEDNPEVEAAHLTPGAQLRIRRSAIGYTSTRAIEKERRARESVAKISVGENEHVVQPGETLYSLSRRFGISEDEILRINALRNHRDIKAGIKIKIAATPASVAEESVEQQDTTAVESVELLDEATTTAEENNMMLGEEFDMNVQPIKVEFLPLGRHNTLKMALMLPFHVRGKVNPNYVDFYKGVLVAMEELKNEGYSIELSVFDTLSNVQHVNEMLTYEAGLLDAQLIIGPVHEGELRHVLTHAEANEILVVTPLADMETLHSPVLFQMQADEKYKSEKLAELFDGSREVVTIYANSNDWDYAEAARALDKGAIRTQLNFVFNRESFFYRRTAEGANGEQVDIEELMRSGSKKLFVIVAAEETNVDRILTTLSSTRASIVGRGLTYGDYTVLGNRRWLQMRNIDRQSFFKNNVLFVVPYHAKRNDEAVSLFDARYVAAFGTLPSMFSYRGYDAAMIFCRKMFTGIDASFQEEVFRPLSTNYRFKFEDGLYINTEWTCEQYRNNFTIETK